jgi:hypothetical protein
MNDLKIKEALLLGSEKRSIQEEIITPLHNSKIASCKNEEERFLDLVTYDYFYNNSSMSFRKYEETLPRILITESKEVAPEVYNEVLRVIFLQDDMVKNFFLRRWISKVAQADKLCHPKYILEVLNSGNNYNQNLRKEIYEIVGEKGRYMLSQFPNEKYNFDVKENIWEHGTLEERKKYFQSLRQADPTTAIELLDEAWQGLNIKEKIAFGKIIADTIETSDLSYINKWYKDYDLIKVDKPTSKELKRLLQSIRCSLDQDLLASIENSLRPYIVKPESGFFKKIFQGPSYLVFNLPSNQDEFWNGDNMNQLFGFEEKNMDIALYEKDSYYWLACMIEILPLEFWCKLLGGDSNQMVEYFLKHENFITLINKEKIPIFKQSLLHNLKSKSDPTLLNELIKHLTFYEIEFHCHLLSREKFESSIIENNLITRADLYHKWYEHNREKWSPSFTKKVMEHIKELAKTHGMYYLKAVGIAMSLYMDDCGNNELEKLDAGFRNESWYSSFRESIMLPVQMGTYINNILNQL